MAKLTLKQWHTKVGAFKRELENHIRKGAERGAEECIPILQRASRAAGADTGGFAAGWRFRSSKRQLRFFNNRPGAGFIENGRDPGKAPPPDVILGWVQRRMNITGPEARRVAYLIGRKIAENGLQGKHVLRKCSLAMRMAVRRSIRRQLLEAWRRT